MATHGAYVCVVGLLRYIVEWGIIEIEGLFLCCIIHYCEDQLVAMPAAQVVKLKAKLRNAMLQSRVFISRIPYIYRTGIHFWNACFQVGLYFDVAKRSDSVLNVHLFWLPWTWISFSSILSCVGFNLLSRTYVRNVFEIIHSNGTD